MIKISFICLFLFSITKLSAQGVAVKVSSGEEPLEFAYININGVAKAITPASGIIVFPNSDLNVGDTISASFVGYSSTNACF